MLLSKKGYPLPLSARIEQLPLILAGPTLRQTKNNSVTVWIALRAPREVTLKVYATASNGTVIQELLLKGSHSTVPLGKYLHIVAVTAESIDHYQLTSGQLYAYDLSFGDQEENLAQALNTANPNTQSQYPITVSYFPHQLPTFAMPPSDLNDLRLAHGSCRKLHGCGQDALPLLDDLIKYHADQPNSRLHQLFLTGDQIYADDVAEPLLWLATEAGDTLLGWEENLPLQQISATGYEYKKPGELKPGQRSDIAQHYGGFTAMLLDSPEEAKSHLLSLGEYLSVYLLCWSPILWPDIFAQGKEVYQDSQRAQQWDKQVCQLQDCLSGLWKVRRALANVTTYTVFDDHDISDDWYMNCAWCNSVLGKPLGRRVVQNGLLAYAVFQAWGNTPEQFQQGQPGENLLKAATIWSNSGGTDQSASVAIAKCLGLPQFEPGTGLPKLKFDQGVFVLDRDYPDGTAYLKWHYTLRSLKHEVVVLDTRTWRGYPQGQQGEIAPPMLLSPTAFEQQIREPLELTDQLKQNGDSAIEVTLVVVPTNMVSLQIIDLVQQQQLEKGNVFDSDVGDAWNLNKTAFSRMLAELFKGRQRVVVLSGDIHFGGAVRLNYWHNPRSENSQPQSGVLPVRFQNSGTLAQLTASAFKNSEFKTHLIHTKLKSLALEPPQDWVGWNKPPQLVEIQVVQGRVQSLDLALPTTGPVVRQIPRSRGNLDVAWKILPKDSNSLPDWQYHVEWIKRQKAAFAPWKEQEILSTIPQQKKPVTWLGRATNLVSILWRNPWVQEGEEVVGHSNFGLISFVWPQNNEAAKAVIQDLYWQPPWQPNSVVYSRYFVSLSLDTVPSSLPSVEQSVSATNCST
ncbi:PhoD-like phosphatase [Lyngbya aestuarii]|uniref:PhoD-like phosphatase n=1 Tax=Lyngbya aestuarii TaxID=118322 RepID=UPI00403D7155